MAKKGEDRKHKAPPCENTRVRRGMLPAVLDRLARAMSGAELSVHPRGLPASVVTERKHALAAHVVSFGGTVSHN